METAIIVIAVWFLLFGIFFGILLCFIESKLTRISNGIYSLINSLNNKK